ncbi:MAG: barstar family protein [Betaproteobacteria bacterium]
MYRFAQLLGHAPSGLYLLTGDWRGNAIEHWCRRARVRPIRVDATRVRNKRTFLRAAGRALECPVWFGMNWDALSDCVTDLTWMPAQAYLVLLGNVDAFAGSAPHQFQTALEIFEEAAEYWDTQGVRFHVLIATDHAPSDQTLQFVRAP